MFHGMNTEARQVPAMGWADGEQSMEFPSVSLKATLSRHVFPVLVTSIVYVISSPTPVTPSAPLARVAPSSEGKHRRRQSQEERRVLYGYARACSGLCGIDSPIEKALRE